MLDYRAHKLFRILWLPCAAAFQLLRLGCIVIAITIAQSTSQGTLIRIIIAYLVFEVISLLLMPIWALTVWMFKHGFFWLIDVTPAHGSTEEEAKDIVIRGRVAELERKLKTDVNNWTLEDTDEFISLGNWRARLFFGGRLRRRLQRQIAERNRLVEDFTTELGKSETEALNYAEIAEFKKRLVEADNRVPDGKPSWFETILINQYSFNSVLAIALIVLVIGLTTPQGHF
jgi:hypothetical protein